MIGDIFIEKEVDMLGKKYIVYLKEVACKLGSGGQPASTTVRAFVRRCENRAKDNVLTTV